jgi:hypothetical protein
MIARACYRRAVSALAVTCIGVAGMSASAQTAPAPNTPASPAAAPPAAWCPLNTRVRDLDDTHTRYAVSFGAFEKGRASGIIALWAGDRRYDVPFRDAVAVDSRDRTAVPSAVVVRFAAPTKLDGAVVTSIDEGGTLRPCDPWFSPWVANQPFAPDRRSRAERRPEEQFLAAARAAAPTDAPAPVTDPAPCASPYRSGRTVYAPGPATPRGAGTGLAMVLVVLDPADKIFSTRIERSAGNPILDATALGAARGSEFQGQIFRCRHVMGSYLFSVNFGT